MTLAKYSLYITSTICVISNPESFLLRLSQGSFLVTQAVAQALVACGAPKGSIITVGSIVGKVRHQQARQAHRLLDEKPPNACVLVSVFNVRWGTSDR